MVFRASSAVDLECLRLGIEIYRYINIDNLHINIDIYIYINIDIYRDVSRCIEILPPRREGMGGDGQTREQCSVEKCLLLSTKHLRPLQW
jgi:hypothetical protein